MITVGMILAKTGPLLLIPTAWLVARYVVRPCMRVLGGKPSPSMKLAWTTSGILLALVVGLSYVWASSAFRRACAAWAVPTVYETVRVDGFQVSPLQAGRVRALLTSGDFDFVEGRRPDGQGFVRYRLNSDGSMTVDSTTSPSSEYELRDSTSSTWWGAAVSTRTVTHLPSGTRLARAAVATFTGGPLSAFLGWRAVATCPDPRTNEGYQSFLLYLELAETVLSADADPLRAK